MAAGVGKTYRMLQEGHAERDSGRDVVIGYLEPHDRPDTIAVARGLEVVPRRRVEYRDTALDEMDLPALLARRPELALIDELAHTNPPGLEHEKRYEDIADVLAAGIDVFSNVNVQHLESLNDQVTELTGVRVRETFPDSVLGTADEVVLVDLTPEALIDRLRAGKVYPGPEHRAGAQQLLPDREPGGASGGGASPGGGGGRVEAARDRAGDGAGGNPRGAGRGRRSEGRRRAGSRPGSAANELAAPGPPGLALGAAARSGARPALGEASPGADSASARRSSSPRFIAWPRCWARTLLIEENDDLVDADRRRRSPPRHHLHLHRQVGAAALAGAAPRAAAPAAHAGGAARRRRAHRRRPRQAKRRGGGRDDDRGAADRGAGARRRGPRDRVARGASLPAPPPCTRSFFPSRAGRSPAAPSMPPCGWRGPRTPS